MEPEKKKEGISVKELESFAKKHRYEVFFSLLFILASLFTLIFWGAVISIFLTIIGSIVGVLFPHKIEFFSRKMASMVFKKESSTQMIIGILALIVAIFLAPLIFLLIGLHAGTSMFHTSREASS